MARIRRLRRHANAEVRYAEPVDLERAEVLSAAAEQDGAASSALGRAGDFLTFRSELLMVFLVVVINRKNDAVPRML